MGNELVVLLLDAQLLETGLAGEGGPDVLVVQRTDLVPLAPTLDARHERLRLHLVVHQLLEVALVHVTKQQPSQHVLNIY